MFRAHCLQQPNLCQTVITHSPDRAAPIANKQTKTLPTFAMSFDTTPFAKLIPSNASARRAFDSLAQNMKDDPVWKPHSRRYIHVNAEKKEVPNVSMEGYGPYEGRKEIWTGFYILSFGVAPIDPRRGWSIGGGIEAAVSTLFDIIPLALPRFPF